jgi:hypothetical protein
VPNLHQQGLAANGPVGKHAHWLTRDKAQRRQARKQYSVIRAVLQTMHFSARAARQRRQCLRQHARCHADRRDSQ